MMTRIAYCLLVHKNPSQVNRLVRNIYSSSDFFYVNVFGDDSANRWKKELGQFEGENFFVIFRNANAWGTFPLVDAMLDSMRKFAFFDYDYYINLSGQCYPLKSTAFIKKFLQNKNSVFMESFKLPWVGWGKHGGLDRIQYYYYRNPVFVLFRFLLNKISRSTTFDRLRFIRIPRINKQLPYNLQPYGGPMWFCLNKKCVDYILEYLKTREKMLVFFKHSLVPDEMFFQTIIMNSPMKNIVVNDSLRYIYWVKKGKPHPAVLTINDTNALFSSSKLFARKFDISLDEKILDLIDDQKTIDV
jgi:hypothetical protein